MALIELEHIGKRYGGENGVVALQNVELTVEAGEMVAILGRSGSGKSTLLHILGCLDRPTAGEYRLAGRSVARMSDRELSDARNRQIGFVFQQFHLLPQLTALENVELPLTYRGIARAERRRQAAECLRQVGLTDRAGHYPRQLSGGQQQRVAVARALAGQPEVLLADEPTGNLDTAAGREIMALLRGWHEAGHTVLLITHDPLIGASCPRRLHIRDGRLEG